MFVFGDFNVYHKGWLSSGTDRTVELCNNFKISKLTQMANFPSRIPDCDSHILGLLDLFISSDATICFTMAFLPLENSGHVVVSVSIDFPLNSQQDVLFHLLTHGNSRADLDGLFDHLRDVPSGDILKLSTSVASEFCECV